MAVEAPVARVVLLGRTSPVLARGGVGTSSRRSDRPATDAAGGDAGEQVGTGGALVVRRLADEQSTGGQQVLDLDDGDRKSTRLNSSHVAISYAVVCLQK